MIEEILKQIVEMHKDFHSQIKSKSKHKYNSMEDFVLKKGKIFKVSSEIIKVKKGKPRECFKNAFHLADSVKGYTYVEGFATTKLIPSFTVLHAWCINEKQEIIDPTWDDGNEYMGIPFNMKYIRNIMLSRKKYGLIDNWEDNFPLITGEHAKKEFLAK